MMVHTTSEEVKIIWQETTMTWVLSSNSMHLSVPLTVHTDVWRQFMNTWTCGNVYVFSTGEAFTWRTICWTVGGRERKLCTRRCVLCALHFSGLYSSAVIQSVIFKRSIYWGQAKMFYRVLQHLNQVLLLNWYNNKLGEKQWNRLDTCGLIWI